MQISGVRGRHDGGGGPGPLVRAKGRAVGRRSDGAAGPVSSLIGSPNHSKKLPVLIFLFSVGCFMNCISI